MTDPKDARSVELLLEKIESYNKAVIAKDARIAELTAELAEAKKPLANEQEWIAALAYAMWDAEHTSKLSSDLEANAQFMDLARGVWLFFGPKVAALQSQLSAVEADRDEVKRQAAEENAAMLMWMQASADNSLRAQNALAELTPTRNARDRAREGLTALLDVTVGLSPRADDHPMVRRARAILAEQGDET